VALDPLAYIRQYESPNGNVRNYRYDPTHTASGYYQITDSTWRDIAPAAGIDTKQYPTAMSAPYGVQTDAATALYNQRGFSPWAPYNPRLSNAIDAAGGSSAFGDPQGGYSYDPPANGNGGGTSGIDYTITGSGSDKTDPSSYLDPYHPNFDPNSADYGGGGTNIFGLDPNLTFSDVGSGIGGLLGSIPGVGSLFGGSSSSSGGWWDWLTGEASSFLTRGGLMLLAIVLIAAAAFALASEHTKMPPILLAE
jgi:hypothetical protein